MTKMTPSELEGWDEIVDDTTSSDMGKRAHAQISTAHKLVLSIVNLQESIKGHGTKTVAELDKLAKSVDKFNENSGKLATAGLWLSGAIVLATISQVIIALVRK